MIKADVSNPDDVKALLSQTEEELGPITDLVNSAALATGIGPIEDLDIEQTRRMLEINVFGLFICCHCAVRRMARRRGGQGGTIINLSSAAARTHASGPLWTIQPARRRSIASPKAWRRNKDPRASVFSA